VPSSKAAEPVAQIRLPRGVGVAFDDLSPGAKIREVALQLFAARGIRATSIRMVAAAAGVSTGAVVHHYRTKQELEQAVHAEVVRRIVETVHRVPPGHDVVAALEERNRAYDTLLRDQPYIADYIRRVLLDDSAASIAFLEQSIEGIRAEMQDRVSLGIAREFEDAEVSLALYWLVVNARFILRPYLERVLGLDLEQPKDLARLHRAEIDLFTNGVFTIQDPSTPT
jgi:AcrR family transcriptional regulator